ncbi:MAG: hypothetical protein KDJ74_10150 [Notoacmeibacter sp.]|nr:hypothetical protein [Notoacmeibacter sp.]
MAGHEQKRRPADQSLLTQFLVLTGGLAIAGLASAVFYQLESKPAWLAFAIFLWMIGLSFYSARLTRWFAEGLFILDGDTGIFGILVVLAILVVFALAVPVIAWLILAVRLLWGLATRTG